MFTDRLLKSLGKCLLFVRLVRDSNVHRKLDNIRLDCLLFTPRETRNQRKDDELLSKRPSAANLRNIH